MPTENQGEENRTHRYGSARTPYPIIPPVDAAHPEGTDRGIIRQNTTVNSANLHGQQSHRPRIVWIIGSEEGSSSTNTSPSRSSSTSPQCLLPIREGPDRLPSPLRFNDNEHLLHTSNKLSGPRSDTSSSAPPLNHNHPYLQPFTFDGTADSNIPPDPRSDESSPVPLPKDDFLHPHPRPAFDSATQSEAQTPQTFALTQFLQHVAVHPQAGQPAATLDGDVSPLSSLGTPGSTRAATPESVLGRQPRRVSSVPSRAVSASDGREAVAVAHSRSSRRSSVSCHASISQRTSVVQSVDAESQPGRLEGRDSVVCVDPQSEGKSTVRPEARDASTVERS